MSSIFLLKCHKQESKLPRVHNINMTSAISAAKSTVTRGFPSYGTPLEEFSTSKSPQQDARWINKKKQKKQTEKGRHFVLECAGTSKWCLTWEHPWHISSCKSNKNPIFPTWWISCHPFSSLQLTVACSWSKSSQQKGSPPTTAVWYSGVRPQLSL